MSKETPAQRRRRLQANWTEDDVYQDESDRLRRSVWMLEAVARQKAAMTHLEALATRQPTDAATRKRITVADRRAARARELRAEGKSYSAIAKALECHPTTVPRLLKRPIPE